MIIVNPPIPMMTMALMTEIANQAGNEIWPPLEVASRWFDRASIVLAISLLFGFGATVAIVWLGIVKEHHWDLLREAAAREISDARGDAGRANEAAGKAHERAAALEAEAEKARAELGKANADIAKANAEIAEAKKQTATLEKETAQARLEQERLKQIVKWRILTPSQLSVLTANLQVGGSANITYTANDPEALYLWTQISKAFPQPTWKMIAQARTYEGVFHAGIFITGPDIPATKTIRDAFTAAGIAFGTQDPGNPHMFFGEPNIPNAPTVFIASRFPAN
jgi:hypothetical protein